MPPDILVWYTKNYRNGVPEKISKIIFDASYREIHCFKAGSEYFRSSKIHLRNVIPKCILNGFTMNFPTSKNYETSQSSLSSQFFVINFITKKIISRFLRPTLFQVVSNTRCSHLFVIFHWNYQSCAEVEVIFFTKYFYFYSSFISFKLEVWK